MTRNQGKPVRRRRHRLRTSIYQAAWNYKYRDYLPKFLGSIALILAILTQSLLVGLIVFWILAMMPHHHRTVGVISFIWGLSWALLVGWAGISLSLEVGFVLAFLTFAYTYVPMRSSEQYWRDLQKDGGPWAD